MEKQPLVSIITVCFNSEKFIKDTIESVLSQTYTNIQYVIVDGKSSDSTVEIIKQYVNRFQGRLVWISEPDKGIYDAMNKGIRLAEGEIIGILNSDDFYVNDTVIQKVVDKMLTKNAECLYADLLFVDSNNIEKVTRKWIVKEGEFRHGWNPPHPTTFVINEIYEKYGMYRTDYKISSDYDFLYRTMNKGKVRTTYLNEYIVKMRIGGESNRGVKSIIQGNKEIYNTLKENNEKYKIYIIISKLFDRIKQLI